MEKEDSKSPKILSYLFIYLKIWVYPLITHRNASPAGPIEATLHIREHFVNMFAGQFLAAIPQLEKRIEPVISGSK